MNALARLRGLVTRVVVGRTSSAGSRLSAEAWGLDVEEDDSGAAVADVEVVEPYGFTARPVPPDEAGGAAEALALALDGSQSSVVLVQAGDRRYWLAGLEEGEVAIYDDQGRYVKLARAGVVVDAPRVELVAGATLEVARRTDAVAVTIPAGAVMVPGSPAAPNAAPITLTGSITAGSSKVFAGG